MQLQQQAPPPLRQQRPNPNLKPLEQTHQLMQLQQQAPPPQRQQRSNPNAKLVEQTLSSCRPCWTSRPRLTTSAGRGPSPISPCSLLTPRTKDHGHPTRRVSHK
ncbi:Protein of unknown function [Gryllus bimaculatus]|nr:Protein of unknown function [Gryllus bimaculatus]